jgi:hypothetical protein
MKKFYTLSFILLASLSFGQTQVITNGDLETWTDASTPTNFQMLIPNTTTAITSGVTKESTNIHGGTYSAKHTTAATSSVKIQNETAILVPGKSYTVSYWFLDNDPLAKSRPWIYFLTSAYATMTDTAIDAAFRPTTYSSDNATWQQFTTTFTAPIGAVQLRFEMRTYAVGTGLGSVYYDDMSVIENPPLSVKQNSISGLNVYPNPVTDGILKITSDSSNAKTVAVYDILGKQVINTKTSNNAVNVSNLKGGAYIIKITEDGKTDTRKLIIQ